MAASMKCIFPSILDHFGKEQTTSQSSKCYQTDILNQHHLETHQKCLLIGERDSGKTALLFQAAVTLAQDGHPVTFITPTKFQSLPPSVEGATPPDPMLMKQINIMYFQDRPALLSYLSGIHARPSLPHAIIIDNLDYYGNHPQTGEMASNVSLLCAYLVDAVTYMATRRSQSPKGSMGEGCLLMASVSRPTQGELSLGHVYRNYLTSVLQITSVDPKDSIFQLTSLNNGPTQSDCIITYKLGQSIKVLDILMGEEASAFSQLTCTSQDGDGNG